MKSKIAMVTGANSGIGKATATGLAKQGATVVLVCRDRERGEAARQDIVRESGNGRVELLLADFASQESVSKAAHQFLERHDRLHVLVNNAGGVFSKPQTSKDGVEMTFAVNYLAPFLLTHLLLPALKAGVPSRIVNVASDMQAKKLDLETVWRPSRTPYSALGIYKEAKLALILFTYELAKRLAGTSVSVNVLHPGVIYTPQSARMVPAPFRPLLKLFMSTPEKGARTSLFLAASEEAAGVTGAYFKDAKPKQSVPVSYDEELQRGLYERSLAWIGAAKK